jgi:hypothetical protein
VIRTVPEELAGSCQEDRDVLPRRYCIWRGSLPESGIAVCYVAVLVCYLDGPLIIIHWNSRVGGFKFREMLHIESVVSMRWIVPRRDATRTASGKVMESGS